MKKIYLKLINNPFFHLISYSIKVYSSEELPQPDKSIFKLDTTFTGNM